MADFPVTGAASYIQYGWEAAATYGTAATTIDKAFGHGQRITVNRNSNLERIWGLGNPYATKITAGRFEGSLTVEFILASTYFLKAVMGTVADADDATFGHSHTYTHNTGYTATSITIENGLNLDTDNVYKYLGCIVSSCEISCTVGEPIRVRLEFLYANESLATSGLDASPATDAEEPMEFAEASLEIPNATAIARVQSFIFTISKEPEILYGLGGRDGKKAVWRRTSYDFRMTTTEENDDFIADEYGQATGPLTTTIPAGEASLELTISNGGSGTARRHLIFLMTTTFLTSDSLPQDVGSTLIHDWTGYCLGHTSMIGMDNTAATP